MRNCNIRIPSVAIVLLVMFSSCEREVRLPALDIDGINGKITVYKPQKVYKGYNVKDGGIYDLNGILCNIYPGEQCLFMTNGHIAAGVEDHLQIFDENQNTIGRTPDFLHKGVHHEIFEAPDASIYFLSSDSGDLLIPADVPVNYTGFIDSAGNFPYYHLNSIERLKNVRYDVMVHVNSTGKILDKWNTFTHLPELKKIIALNRNPLYADTLTRIGREYFHFNSIQTLPHNPYEKTNPAFKAGNLLLSEMYFDMVLILDPVNFNILWYYFQPEANGHGQHSPRMQPNGNIVMFVNVTTLPDSARTPYSKAVEINPVNKQVVWEYTANPPQSMYGDYGGHTQRLPNGNTLITVDTPTSDTTQKSFVLEVTRQKEVVWKWYPDLSKMAIPGLYRVNRLSEKDLGRFVFKNY